MKGNDRAGRRGPAGPAARRGGKNSAPGRSAASRRDGGGSPRGHRAGTGARREPRRPGRPETAARGAGFPDAEVRTDLLVGRNPVREALRSGRPVEKLIVQRGSGPSLGKILEEAKERDILIETAEKATLDRLSGKAPHQGVIALTAAHDYSDLEDLFDLAAERSEDPFFILLDGIEDPQNLGAIMRTAECCGAHGVIIPKHRAVGLTAACAKASAGAVEYVPCVRVPNLARCAEDLKARGLWIYACDMDGTPYSDAKLEGPCALVIGAEGSGISRLVKEKCDFVVSMPMRGHISSLNASNAAAVLMYEVRRQRDHAAE